MFAGIERHHQTARSFGDETILDVRNGLDEFACVYFGLPGCERSRPRVRGLLEAREFERTHARKFSRACRVTGDARRKPGLDKLDDRWRDAGILERKRQRGGDARLSNVGVGTGYEVTMHFASPCTSKSMCSRW
jgi:hypothetical protein